MPDLALSTPFTKDALAVLPPAGPFVRTLREQALAEFEAAPIPSQETEEWRYTDLSAFDFDFAPFTPGGGPEAVNKPGVLNAAGVAGERAGLLIQRNSEVISTQLADGPRDKGVIVASLDRAAVERAELVDPYLHAIVPSDRTKFTALHAAFRTGGTFVYVPDGVTVELPLQALTYLDEDGAAVFPHTLLVVGEDAEVTFIDRYASPDLSKAFSDAVVEIHAGRASRVRYLSIQDWGAGVTHLSVQRAVLGRDAQFHSLSVQFGGDLARSEFESIMSEPGAHSEMLGLYFASAAQHYDHRTLQDHVAPNCTSDLLYKGALRESSRAIYSGWVHIRPDARNTDAFQTNRNLVLSDRAKADAIPNLEIENNEVRCGHAASVGPVEEETLFYLESRGIPRKEAERLIVFGFFQEVLDRVPLPEVRQGLSDAIERELGRESA